MRVNGAVEIDTKLIVKAAQISAPSCNPKITPLCQPVIPSRTISQTTRITSSKKDAYPTGINANAFSGGSKNGCGFAYKGARIPACSRKSNPITLSQASKVMLTKRQKDSFSILALLQSLKSISLGIMDMVIFAI
jgi:hypothetical protein